MAEKGQLSINSENMFPIIKKWLYSDHDIFYRELISNGCDAITKLKKLEMMGETELPEGWKARIDVVLDPESKTIQITDNGLGMTADEVKEYINNMPELLAAADLVISRAGALTLAELEAEGRAAILIPSPNVAENHQYYNAMELQKAGAAVVIEEKDLTGEKLVSTVSGLLAEPGKLAAMGRNARTLSVDDSLDRIADALMKLVKTP